MTTNFKMATFREKNHIQDDKVTDVDVIRKNFIG